MLERRFESSGPLRPRRLAKALLAAVLAGTAGLRTVAGKKEESINRDARIDLIRGLSSEIVVAKVELPRGRKGLSVNSKGEINKQAVEGELKVNGVAIRAGMPVAWRARLLGAWPRMRSSSNRRSGPSSTRPIAATTRGSSTRITSPSPGSTPSANGRRATSSAISTP